ncbi:MAG: hypothetical protein ACYTCU_04185 [Planctomycetota bacterium]|jgi:hypothetical protein
MSDTTTTMPTAAPGATPERATAPGGRGMESLHLRLDQVRGRVRLLRATAGAARLVMLSVFVLALLYTADRWLVLPLAVRGLILFAVAVLGVREIHRRIGRPLFGGADREDTARLVESQLPGLEGRLISALQLGGGPDGSMEQRLLDEASSICQEHDLREVLVPGPSLTEVWRAAAAVVALGLLVAVVQPYTDVFAQRWTMHEVAWPRATRLELIVPDQGPAHRLLDDGTLVVAKGGVIEAEAALAGEDPGRVELVVAGRRGDRAVTMSSRATGGWIGRVAVEAGDETLFVRGGDDSGRETRLDLTVIEPPRLDTPVFHLEPPAYLGAAASTVGPEGLAVPEGTRITMEGEAGGSVTRGELRLAASGEIVPLEIEADGPDRDVSRLSGSFTANLSDSLSIVLSGDYDLATQDPSQHALLVRPDRPPSLRVFAPARSDVKVTENAVVPFAVIAEDDHAVAEVLLRPGSEDEEPPMRLQRDVAAPDQYRLVLDFAEREGGTALGYQLVAHDGRDLPGKGPQSALVDGRRVDVVEESEVQRLLADRQLRLKDAFKGIRDRQQTAIENVGSLLTDTPPADHPDLVAEVVAQNQITTRLTREVRELCGVLDDTILNRLDPGPGAAAVLDQRLADWHATPVNEGFAPAPWRAMADDYTAGRYGRLDLLGRLLDMAGLALEVEQVSSPEAHRLLGVARAEPTRANLEAAQAAQVAVLAQLDKLLGRMDEWEDFQEVLLLVKTLIDDQRSARSRTQEALTGEKGSN